MLELGALETPVLLLAMPQVQDLFFQKSVVLLVHHDDEGSLGFIVNRPTGIRVFDILQDMKIDWGGEVGAVAHFGGPVQPELGSVIFAPLEPDTTLSDTASEVLPGLALSQHLGDLAQLAADPPHRFRLLLGYAGWSAGQLMEEIRRNDWLMAPATAELVFHADRAEVWELALRSVGIDPATLPAWTPTPAEESPN